MTDPLHAEETRLPQFCGLPALAAAVGVAELVVLVMALAPDSPTSFRALSTASLLVVWLALLVTVALCKLTPWLRRLLPTQAYFAAWAAIVAIVAAASGIVWWLDHALDTALTPDGGARFVLGNALLAALLGAALLRYFYVLAQWRSRLAAVARAQVEALQARIRPHFLFNSMNTVAALVRVDPAAAERTLEDLAELFRAALGADGRVGTLGEELDLIDRYLAIEQLRLGERLRVERDLDALPRALPLPPLLLQPLVENAVLHGIQPRPAGGCVRIAGWREADAVVIEVANPLPADAARAATARNGHGLDSVRRRIGYHFGARAALEVARDDDGFTVTLRLPDAHPDRR
ncbi:MAG: histidine kinase [Mizugakiibacter sp.]|uniref:sensor histidine kinase n=1 Tax=Mizugakiibacter sp. TaxID=1972610 RepID=UPI0031BFDB56|nr:histidine kinase [Xanthomonadaceae bacterium]